MRQRNRDPQQQAVYKWESEWKAWNRSTATLTELREAIRWACRLYRIKKFPRVKVHDGGEYSFCFEAPGKPAIISVQRKWQMNSAVALHEVSHYICDEIFPGVPVKGKKYPQPVVQDHGIEWLGIFMALLQEANVIPTLALHATAKAHGLKWVSYADIGPKAFKRGKP